MEFKTSEEMIEHFAKEARKQGKTALEKLKEMKEIQGEEGTIDQGDYMVGLYNGLELAIATIEDREPEFKSKDQ